jgi:hypothetical protein
VDVVIVKTFSQNVDKEFQDIEVTNMWSAVKKDIEDNNLQGKAVVNYSGGGKIASFRFKTKAYIYKLT